MAAIYLPLSCSLHSSYANTVHSCGSFTVQGKRSVERWVGGEGVGGASEEQELDKEKEKSR